MKIYDKNRYISDHFRDAYIPENKQIETIINKVDDIKDTGYFSNKIDDFKDKIPDFF